MSNVIELPFIALQDQPKPKPELLALPTRDLLEKFGAGRHQPGSGSAAALSGVLSCKLLRTVIALCQSRAHRVDRLRVALPNLNRFENEIVATIEPYLLSAIQTDAEQFEKVIVARKRRDGEPDFKKKKMLASEALEELLLATEIPLEIAEHCMTLGLHGLEVFDRGFLAARGDSGVAIATAGSAALGALSVVFLNLKNFKEERWEHKVVDIRHRADALLAEARSLQFAALRRVQKLQRESGESPQLQLL